MKTAVLALVGVVLLALVSFLVLYKPMVPSNSLSTRTVLISTDSTSSPQATVVAEVANTPALQEHGLSGRQTLEEGKGMLFVFNNPDIIGFWMKDMNFAIDIIFADASGRVVTIAENATPDSYHEVPPKVFYPSVPATYVLEVPAGFAARHTIRQNSQIVIQ